jgi:hypothetical protein
MGSNALPLHTTLPLFSKTRSYETAGVASDREATEMQELAASLRDDVLSWLRKHHPKLLQR